MQHFGSYRGIVLKNDDPTRGGRVKVWVPAIHKEIYEDDIAGAEKAGQPASAIIGNLTQSVINKIANELPWADVAQPMMGGGGSAYSYGSGGSPSSGSTVGSSPAQNYGDGYPQASGVGVSAKVTRYGYTTDPYANSNDLAGIGNNGNKLTQGKSVALSPELYEKLGLRKKPSSPVFVTFADGSVKEFSADDQTAPNLSPNLRIDFYDPNGQFVNLDGSYVKVSAQRASETDQQTSAATDPESTEEEREAAADTSAPEVESPAPTSQSPASSFAQGNCDGQFATNSGTRIFCGSRNDLKAKTGKFSSGPNNRIVSLDFNAASPAARGYELAVPSNLTAEEEALCNAYLDQLGELYRRNGISNKKRGNGLVKKNFRGIIFTEPFFNGDHASIDFIAKNYNAYNQILLNTLGKISGVTLIAPHNNSREITKIGPSGEGAVLRYNGETITEREWAMRYYIRPMAGGSVVSTSDAFSAVGNKHPEEARDETFLSGLGVDKSEIQKTVDIGKKIYEAQQLAKTKPTTENIEKVNSLKEQRKQVWSNIKVPDDEDGAKKSQVDTHFTSKNLDYSDKPVNNIVNPASQTVAHTPYSNVSHGAFTIPEVGANVWVFFEGGDIEFPVVQASAPLPKDYAGVYDISSPSPDYPETQAGDEANIHRNKSVVTSRGGSLEMVDTTGRERVKLTSYHGSSYDMNQLGASEFTVGGKTQLVKGDKFTTVRGSYSSHTDGDRDNIIIGDVTNKYGKIKSDVEIAKRIKELHKPIHEKQQLFDLQRTGKGHSLDSSPHQEMKGENTKCPTCSGEHKFPTRSTTASKFTPASSNGSGGKAESLTSGESTITYNSEDPKTCFNCGGSGTSPWSAEGKFERDPRKAEIPEDINRIAPKMSELENRLGSGGNVTDYIAKSKTVFIGSDMNDLNSIRVDPVGKRKIVGQMPSSSGKGVFPMYEPTPHIEPVATSSLAGGDYSMMVANKYSLLVGANGISQKTLGMYELQGRIMTVTAEQLNISSNNEILIDGGRVTTITGDIVNIVPRTRTTNGGEYKTVAMDSSIAVSSNMVVKGAAHIEGGINTQHITAPLQYSETETTISTSNLRGGIVIAKDSMGGDVVSIPVANFADSEHSHMFPTASSTLLPTNDDVRECGSACAGAEPILAPPVENVKSRDKGKQTPIRYRDPNLFALNEDCVDDDFNKIVDFIADSKLTPAELEKELEGILTKASDSELSTVDPNCDPCNN